MCTLFYKKYFKDVSREFDEFQVNTHLCKLRCWYFLIYYMGEFLLGGVLFFVHYNGKCWYFYFGWGILSFLFDDGLELERLELAIHSESFAKL